MTAKQYHFFAGILSLLVNIMLPTLIYYSYQDLINSCDKTIMYKILFMLLLWVSTLIIAIHELAGSILRIANHNYKSKYLCNYPARLDFASIQGIFARKM